MAYLKEIPKPKCRNCHVVAKVVLVNARNSPCGEFCTRCARTALKDMERRERAA
jgi:hypothetical protein